MAVAKRLIIGLGNIGPAYEGTRHNIGFDVVDAIAVRSKTKLSSFRFNATYGWGRWKGFRFALAKPSTYMNRSGLAVRAIMRHYAIPSSNILIIVDDIHLPLGSVRIRKKGGSGGHNGLEHILEVLQDDAFPRMRIGVGNAYERGQQAAFVLSPFTEQEEEVRKQTVTHASDAALSFVTDGIATAMNRFNRR